MSLRLASAGVTAVVLLAGCGHARPGDAGHGQSAADAAVEHELLRGVHEIRTTHDRTILQAQLGRIVARLRVEHGSTAAVERARVAALAGFESTRAGVRSQIDFVENDSGEVAAATRDARRADRYLGQGADQIRRAGQALGLHIGALAGY